MHPLYNIIGNPTSFLENIFHHLNTININVEKYPIDHICYRTESAAQYFHLKKELNDFCELLTESQINNRPIATFKLPVPIIYKNRKIYLLELPAPKPRSFYPAGYEHVEFVIEESLEQFIEKYSNINFDKKGMSKKINPDVRIKFDGYSVKFHLYDLEYVIRYLD